MKNGKIPAYIATGLVCIAAMIISRNIVMPLVIYTCIFVMMED